MNIVLIGYRGTGKSTIAEILGERLSMRVVGMDAEIARRAGKPIPEIVEEFGWDHFRDIESGIAADLGSEDGLIIDAGGGVIVRSQNIDSLRKNGIVFWLMADERTIVDRIKDDMQRPSLSGSKSFVDDSPSALRSTRRPPTIPSTPSKTARTRPPRLSQRYSSRKRVSTSEQPESHQAIFRFRPAPPSRRLLQYFPSSVSRNCGVLRLRTSASTTSHISSAVCWA